jgi:homoserine acetyltransferase
MKQMMLCLCIAAVFTACTTTQNAEQKQNEQQEIAQRVVDSLDNRTFTVSFNYMTTRRFQGRALTSDYVITIQGDSLQSYLPYIGEAYRASFDNQSPLHFNGHADHYTLDKSKSEPTRVYFRALNKMETIDFRLDVFSNGRAVLYVNSTDREPISFNGEMDLN